MTHAEKRPGRFPLALAARGACLLVAALRAERRVVKRLGDLGLRRGAEIEVVHRRGDGSLVVQRHNARLALGAQTAGQILVTPAAAPGPSPASGA